MDYSKSVHDLVHAGQQAETLIDLEVPDLESKVNRAVFGGDLCNAIAAVGYPGGTEIPWMVEELYIFGLDELQDRQVGYREDAKTRKPSAGWDSARYVIAEWTANPVSICSDGSISYARHGQGAWVYHELAPDLPSFFDILSAWLRYFVVERGGNLFDEDFEITQKTREELRSEVLHKVDPRYHDTVSRFLLGEI